MNVLIVAKSLIVRESMSNIFKKVYKETNIKTTDNIDKLAIDKIKAQDIILATVVSNDLNTLSKITQLKNDKNKVIILDQLKSEKSLKLCIEENIDGYVVDFENEDEFKYIINRIMCGKKFYDSEVIKNTLVHKSKVTDLILTHREEEVIVEVKKGLSNKEVADKLGVTEFTVKKHMTSILSKLNLKNRKDLIIHIRENIL
ncbi:MAG: response regulator transcription factor [Peptostreptococcaceae bacterium]